jgi:transposase
VALSPARLPSAHLDRAVGGHAPALPADRAGPEGRLRAGRQHAQSVAAVARDLGSGWHTVMRAVRDHGETLVEDPARLADVAALGVDETTFLAATRTRHTRYVSGLVDITSGRLLDFVEERTARAIAH